MSSAKQMKYEAKDALNDIFMESRPLLLDSDGPINSLH